jgi:hypothetical protein
MTHVTHQVALDTLRRAPEPCRIIVSRSLPHKPKRSSNYSHRLTAGASTGVDEDVIIPQQRAAVRSAPVSNEFLALDEQQAGPSSPYHHHQVNDSPPVTRVDRRRVLPNFPESNFGHTNGHVMDETHGVCNFCYYFEH